MPRFRFAQILWVMLLVCGFMLVGNDQAEAEEALASWYGPGFDGLPTATGEAFDAGGLTAAHKTLPMGTDLIVGYGGKFVPVTVNDRGPFTGERELDLSQGAAQELGLIGAGVDWVNVECANGGIYPNCSATNVPVPPISAPIQGEPILQYSAGTPDASGVPGIPGIQDEASTGTYVVQPGETLTGIADELGISMDQLMVDNGISDPNFIYGGQPLLY